MALPKTFPLRASGGEIAVPAVGFGTWAAGSTNWCYEATLTALKAGYRHLDCAWNYGVRGSFSYRHNLAWKAPLLYTTPGSLASPHKSELKLHE